MGTEAKHLHSQPYRASIYSECERNDLLLETERERVSLRESSIFLENSVSGAWACLASTLASAPGARPTPSAGHSSTGSSLHQQSTFLGGSWAGGVLGDPGQVILAQWPSPHWLLGVMGSSGVSEGDHPGEG